MNKDLFMCIFKYLDSGYLLILREVNKKFCNYVNLYFENYDTNKCKLDFLECSNIGITLHLIKYYPHIIELVIISIIKRWPGVSSVLSQNADNIVIILDKLESICNFEDIQINSINNNINNTILDKIFEYGFKINLTSICTKSLLKYNNIYRYDHIHKKYKYSIVCTSFNKYRNCNDLNIIKKVIENDNSIDISSISKMFKFNTIESLDYITKYFKHPKFFRDNLILNDIFESDNLDLFKYAMIYIGDLSIQSIIIYGSIKILKYLFEINVIDKDILYHYINNIRYTLKNTYSWRNETLTFLNFIIHNDVSIPNSFFISIINNTKNYELIKTIIYNYNFKYLNIIYLIENPIIGIIYNLFDIKDIDTLNLIDSYIKIYDMVNLNNNIKYNTSLNKTKIYSLIAYININENKMYDNHSKQFIEFIDENMSIKNLISIYHHNFKNNLIKYMESYKNIKLTIIKWYVKQIGGDNLHIKYVNTNNLLEKCRVNYPFIYKYLIRNNVFNFKKNI